MRETLTRDLLELVDIVGGGGLAPFGIFGFLMRLPRTSGVSIGAGGGFRCGTV